MFALSLLMLFALAFVNMHNMRTIARTASGQNALSFVMSSTNCLVAIGLFFAIGYHLPYAQAARELFNDPRLYLTLLCELLGYLALRRNFTVNHASLTAINVSLLLSLLYVPALAYFASGPLGFTEHTLKIHYQHPGEFWLVMGVITLLVLGFFIDKFKRQHVASWTWLMLAPAVLSMCMFLSGKMMQTHSPFLVGATIGLSNACIFAGLSFRHQEWGSLRTARKSTLLKFILFSAAFTPLTILSVSVIAVEFFAILKRSTQVVCARIMDHFTPSSHAASHKDTVLVIMLMLLSAGLYVWRG